MDNRILNVNIYQLYKPEPFGPVIKTSVFVIEKSVALFRREISLKIRGCFPDKQVLQNGRIGRALEIQS